MSGNLPKDHTVCVYDMDAEAWTHASGALIDSKGKEVAYFSLYPDQYNESSIDSIKGIDKEDPSAVVLHIYKHILKPMLYCKGILKLTDREEHPSEKTKFVSIPISKQEFDDMLAKAQELESDIASQKIHYSVSPLLGMNCGGFVHEVLHAGLKHRSGSESLFAISPAQKLVFLPSTQYAKLEKFHSGASETLAPSGYASSASFLSLGTGMATSASFAKIMAKQALRMPPTIKVAAVVGAFAAGCSMGSFLQTPQYSSQSPK